LNFFPKHVQIQTTAYCNGACPYCPYPSMHTRLELGDMEDELVEKLLDQCIYHGAERIILYLMNEPLMDLRLPRWVRYIRERSDTLVEISTNGKFLDSATRHWMRQTPYLIVLVNINWMTDLDAVAKLIMPNHNCYVRGIMYRDYTRPEMRLRTELIFKRYGASLVDGVVDDRAGNVKLDDGAPRRTAGRCRERRDTDFMHVLWNGDVVLCCQDWGREVVLGNAAKTSLIDIFNSEEYAQQRRYKVDGYPQGHLCTRCARLIE